MDIETPTEAQAVESYLKLLLSFQGLPETKLGRTFMDVSGYPHYENVCSNILAFYFDSAAEHELKDLLISAFLQMAGIKELPPFGIVHVTREYGTDEGNRIDIIIDCETVVIGIENKIYHTLNNDLEEYSRVIDQRGGGKKVIKAVLGLHPIKKQLERGLGSEFQSYTYSGLWKHVRALLGHYISDADPKWVTYLMDFMQTTTNLAGENIDLNKTDSFFIEHNDLLEKLFIARNGFLSRLYQKVYDLRNRMCDETVSVALSKKPWVFEKSCLVLDFLFKDKYEIAFDLNMEPTGWQLTLFGRDKQSTSYLHSLTKQPQIHAKLTANSFDGKRYNLRTSWSPQTDIANIKDEMCKWITILADANKTVAD